MKLHGYGWGYVVRLEFAIELDHDHTLIAVDWLMGELPWHCNAFALRPRSRSRFVHRVRVGIEQSLECKIVDTRSVAERTTASPSWKSWQMTLEGLEIVHRARFTRERDQASSDRARGREVKAVFDRMLVALF